VDLKQYFSKQRKLIDSALKGYLPKNSTYPKSIHEAMRYSVMGSGKRFRPILAIATYEALGGKSRDVLSAACALELIHSYSLIHDDLPSMDNDSLRRGKPACHKKFGEAIAVLAGDSLLTLSFQVLSQVPDARITKRLISDVSHAVGSTGMIGGQVVDKETEHVARPELPEISYINIQKTGQLIRASCLVGAVMARASLKVEKAIEDYGRSLGLSFQIVDDIIDGDGFTKIMSRHEAYDEAKDLVEKAKSSIQFLGRKAKRLNEIADFVLNRKK